MALLTVQTTRSTAPPATRADRHPLDSRLIWGAGGIAAVTVSLWALGGGLAQISQPGGIFLVAGQLSGFGAALGALAGLILVARPVWLEHTVGLDRLWACHRVVGIATVLLLAVHVAATLLGYSGGRLTGMWSSLIGLLGTQSWMVAAVVSAVLMLLVASVSWRAIRQRLNYESWYFLHLTGYLAVVFGFGHQLTVGADLQLDSVSHTVMFGWWVLLAVVSVSVILVARLGGLMLAAVRGRATITHVAKSAEGIVSV